MHSLERIIRLNSATNPPPHPLYWHPRIAALRHSLGSLSIDEKYRARLRATLYRYAQDFTERPFYKPGEGWDDLEALQQTTLANALEDNLRAMANKYGRIGR